MTKPTTCTVSPFLSQRWYSTFRPARGPFHLWEARLPRFPVGFELRWRSSLLCDFSPPLSPPTLEKMAYPGYGAPGVSDVCQESSVVALTCLTCCSRFLPLDARPYIVASRIFWLLLVKMCDYSTFGSRHLYVECSVLCYQQLNVFFHFVSTVLNLEVSLYAHKQQFWSYEYPELQTQRDWR